ncbi:MAG: sulfite exporter TauE/SafE family protein [Coriobacteriia bacterium]|nr:sulfite exporter TauE/SafE family protein [Coriobacteriia bacterium]
MWDLLQAAMIGLVAGYLSGQFGVGGGIVTTPAIRLLLDRPELVAVGTPLPVIIPTAVAGAIAYARRGLIDLRVGVSVGIIGAGFAVLGAWATQLVGGRVVLLVTAGLIAWMAVDMALLALTSTASADARKARAARSASPLKVALLGVGAGLYSGFLGLGGGFVVVPVLVRHFGFDMKRAIGTSLVVVSILAVPGSITHYLLGNVEVGLALGLALGVVPGALLGSHVTVRAQEKSVRLAFAGFLAAVGAVLALSELGVF